MDPEGKVGARFVGQFVEQDPKGRFSGGKLACEVVVGTWQKTHSSQSLPVYLSSESITIGALNHRYEPAGAQDDELVHRNALRFWDAVKRGNKNVVAASVVFPIKVQIAGGRKTIGNAAQLLVHYDAVFTPSFRAAIAQAMPRNMFVRDQGIMLGNGSVWFNPEGKVIALNN
jgi:hypothetical protein